MTRKPKSCQLFILWGSKTLELNWIHSSSKSGQASVARATSMGFWVRQDDVCTDLESVAEQAHEACKLLLAETDLSHWATHRVQPPSYRTIEPLPSCKGTTHVHRNSP